MQKRDGSRAGAKKIDATKSEENTLCFASIDLKRTSDLIAKRDYESAAFPLSGKSALVEGRRSAWRRGLLFVFITPPPLASGAGMQPGFERVQMCYYLRVQMHPDTFARSLTHTCALWQFFWLGSVWVA